MEKLAQAALQHIKMMTGSNKVLTFFEPRKLVVHFFVVFALVAASPGCNIMVIVAITGTAVVTVIIVFVVIFTVGLSIAFDSDFVVFIDTLVILVSCFSLAKLRTRAESLELTTSCDCRVYNI